MSTTTAREIADWHRAEAQRLRETPNVADIYGERFRGEYLLDRIKLHERFAAWLEEI